jgi:antitoxin component YwqK of YwqJK toxin-antitoxin module
VVRFHTLAFALTCAAACGSSASTPKASPNDPPVVAQASPEDAAIDAPPQPPKLVCGADTTPVAAQHPDPTWACTRADGTRHGPFVTLHPDGSIELRGAYDGGLLDGAWQRHHHTGAMIEEGTYVTGQKHGTWRQISASGTPLGSYEMAAGSGVEKRWYDEGPLYSETAYQSGVRHGVTKAFTRDGVILESARYQKGKLDGPHSFGSIRTMRFEETFVAGVRRGQRRIFHQTSLIADETYDRLGRLTGPYVSWRSTKIKRVEGQYAAGKRTGHWEWNDRDGKKEREGDYASGKRHGDWFEWADEKLVWNGTYSYGKPHGTFSYFAKNGNEIGKFDIYGGTGWMIEFHGNGKAASRQKLVGGVENGPYQETSRVGKLIVSGNFAAGVKHGPRTAHRGANRRGSRASSTVP